MPTNWRSPRYPKKLHRGVAPRSAFTLAEILLVLAVLVVIAAFAVPTIKGSLENYRLRKAADTIRAAFASSRAAAARSGMTHIFKYTPDSKEYTIEPWSTGDEFVEISSSPTINMGGASSTSPTSMVQAVKITPLPDGILFHGATTDSSLRDMRTISGSGDSASAMNSAQTGGATPILFYSDGSCSNTTVVLKNGRGSYVTIKLRGLTGHATASKLLSESRLSSQLANSKSGS
jgi:prepilin-type N-terminal cleavage/methylation domain-containing protein